MTEHAVRTEREPGRMRIGGELVEGATGERLDILNPATGEVITTTPAAWRRNTDL